MIRRKNKYLDKIKRRLHVILLLLMSNNKFKFLSSFWWSKAQLNQDLFVLNCVNYKSNGFFIEFGACDGIYFSNTFMLEKLYNWNGILSEPCVKWHNNLRENRSAKIDYRCVWSHSGELADFIEDTNDPALSMKVSENVVGNYGSLDIISKYSVMTVSLNDLLESNNAPFEIDFLSVDTEGSEFEILSTFDFSKYTIKVICVEHNYNSNRERIFELLTKYGYIRKYKYLSRFDDWYVLSLYLIFICA